MPSSIARWNGIQWVIVSDTDDINSKLVIPPAEAGPRDDLPTQARFGHIGQHYSVGFMADSSGINQVINAHTQPFYFWQRNAAGTGVDLLGTLSTAGFVVGPAKMSLRADVPAANEAYFGHATQHGSVGFICLPAGANQVISAYNEAMRFYQRNSSGAGHDLLGYVSTARTTFNGWAMSSSHPVHGGYASIWRDGNDAGDRYILLSTVSETMLNAISAVYLRVSNSTALTAQSGAVSVHVPLNTAAINASGLISSNGDGENTFYGQPGRGKIHNGGRVWADTSINSGSWIYANILAQAMIYYGYGVRIACHLNGVGAPQWRVTGNSGEAWEAVTQNADNWCNVVCADAVEVSALATKKDVRTLRPEREYISVFQDPEADTVEGAPDIMALRPVAFRRKKPMQRPVKIDPDGDPSDAKTWGSEDYPLDTVHGRESRRERLGLIADEVQHVIPSAIHHSDKGEVVGINWSQVTVALLDHVQELTRTIDTLQYRVAELERGEP